MVRSALVLLAVGVMLVSAGALHAVVAPTTRAAIEPNQQEAIDAGLKWLAGQLETDSIYVRTRDSTGVTSIAGLAFLASGSTEADGPYSRNVRAAIDYVAGAATEGGMFPKTMYDHAFASVFLAQACAATKDKGQNDALRKKLTAAAALIQKAQNRNGGWRYTANPTDADVCATSCQLLALRAIRDVGVEVDQAVIDRGRQYVESCRAPDGGFKYMAGAGASGWSRTAAASAVLGDFGPLDGNAHGQALAYLRQGLSRDGAPPQTEAFAFYGGVFLMQALSQAGQEDWDIAAPAFQEWLAGLQCSGGQWKTRPSDECATAMALVVLQWSQGRLSTLAWKPQPQWEKEVSAPADEKTMQKFWEDLGGQDTAKVWVAQASLVAGGGKTVGFLGKRLTPGVGVAPKRVEALIAALDSDDLKVREESSKELARIAPLCREQLRKAARDSASPEVRQRASELLAMLADVTPETRQGARAIRVLERIGSPEAIAVLTSLASNESGAVQATLAKSVLNSLKANPSKPSAAP